MRPHLTLTVVLAMAGLAVLAHARDGSFAVGVQVVDRRAVPALLDAIPVPPRAQEFAAGEHGRSYAYPGTAGSAAAFYETAMAQRGYRLLARRSEGGGVRQVWADQRTRVSVDLDQAFGASPLTRIRIGASAAAGTVAAEAPRLATAPADRP
ncbi:hypothetical protein FZO89_08430 [Luteimonas viscosa]|uniref:Uncharacterized protein n=1 Tax=Luteimonas viscosa TaxID=1132694 RepID=A0A5D4XQP8_9GAMM|nr:hypothetical protein [Luteimonas viscosa]TYT26285.1 hypothetical protein FZO89_08430 [Luteimonas viscosa]